MDTTRADHLSCYGFDRETTPNIDALVKEGVLFEQCTSPVPFTLPAHSSMLTGTNPVYHGVHNNMDYILAPDNTTLAELLSDNGFATGAVVSTFVLNQKFGMDQGFDMYDDTFRNPISTAYESERRGDEASQIAIEWIEKNKDDDFFLFLHYYDPHHAYKPPEPFFSEYRDNLYAGEIAYTDYCIKQVLDTLKQLKIYDDALIIIVGDHGEGRGDHGEEQHGYYIYQSCVHVPLIVKFPDGKHKNKSVADSVGIVDIVPTICRWTGVQTTAECIGKDLTGYMETESIDDRFIYSESLMPTQYGCSSLLGLVSGNWKYIQSSAPEMYNLQADPGELENLIEPEAKRARVFQKELQLTLEEQVHTRDESNAQAPDQETIEKLRSLGYVAGGSITEDFEFDTSKPAPVEWFEVYQQVNWFLSYMGVGQFKEAEETSLKILKDKPYYVIGYFYLADARRNLGKYEEAISTAREFLKRAQDKLEGKSQDKTQESVEEFMPDAYILLGKTYFQMKQYQEAVQELTRAFEIEQNAYDQAKIRNNIGNVYLAQNQLTPAMESFLEAKELDPYLPEAYSNIGLVHLQKGDFDDAMAAFEKAMELKPEWDFPKQQLQQTRQMLTQRAQVQQAIAQLESELENTPDRTDLLDRLGGSYLFLGDRDKAVGYWEQCLLIKPDNPDVLNNLAFLYADKNHVQTYDLGKALEYAQTSCKLSKYQNPNFLDTLALIQATRGDFEQAIEISEQALDLALSSNQSALAESIQKSIEQYQKRELP
jgi:arylsulfatase A-like enzyme/Tfp pilus assembly protein PilF